MNHHTHFSLISSTQLHPFSFSCMKTVEDLCCSDNVPWFACFYKLMPHFCIQTLYRTSYPSPLLFSFVYPLQPAPPNPYPSIHLPWIHLYKKIGCKYFGVECQRISPPPAGRQPQSNQPCLFVQLKLFVPCFLWHATPSSSIKCFTFSFSLPFFLLFTLFFFSPSFCVCVSWKQR